MRVSKTSSGLTGEDAEERRVLAKWVIEGLKQGEAHMVGPGEQEEEGREEEQGEKEPVGVASWGGVG